MQTKGAGGSCPTCPNAPKSPSDWLRGLGPATQVVLLATLIISSLCLFVRGQQSNAITIGGVDPDTGRFVLSGDGGSRDGFGGMLVGTIVAVLLQLVTFPLCFFFDVAAQSALGLLLDIFMLVSFLSRFEHTICGVHVHGIFSPPGATLFSDYELRDTEACRHSVLVRSVRTLYSYGGLCVGVAVLEAALWVLTCGGFPIVWPARPVAAALTAAWCFLEPPGARLKLPLFGSLLPPRVDKRTGRREEGVPVRVFPFAVAAVGWLLSGGQLVGVLQEGCGIAVGVAYARVMSATRREDAVIPRRVLEVAADVLYRCGLLSAGRRGQLAQAPLLPRDVLDVPSAVWRFIKRRQSGRFAQLQAKQRLTPWAH